MDFHIRLGTAHRRLARPAHPSCPHLGDERSKLPARHQQEGTAAIGSGAKPKNQNTKRRRARRRHLAHFVSAIDTEIVRVRSLGLDALRTLWRVTFRSSPYRRPISDPVQRSAAGTIPATVETENTRSYQEGVWLPREDSNS